MEKKGDGKEDSDKDDDDTCPMDGDKGEDEESEEADLMQGKKSILADEHHIFDKIFVNYFMSEIHLKIYDYTETEEQNDRKKLFK
tara:strand:- start:525 stop:779 length:255 start_codon:yes stop_codon:yes gene_type:complete